MKRQRTDVRCQMSEKDSGNSIPATVVFVLFMSLSACGFSPVYGPRDDKGVPVERALGFVAIDSIPDRHGQFLRNHLIDRFYTKGRPAQPTTRLSVALEESEEDLGLRKDATASRRQISVEAAYTLKNSTGRTLFSGAAHSVVNTSSFEAQYGTLAAQRDAYERALREVGEQIANRLSLYFAEHAPDEIPTYPSFLLPNAARKE